MLLQVKDSKKTLGRFSARKKLPIKNFLSLAIIAGIIIVLILAFLVIQEKFTIKLIDTKINNVDCAEDLLSFVEKKLVGQKIWTIDKIKISNEVKNRYQCISRVDIKITYPDKVSMEVYKKSPAAIISLIKKEEKISTTSASFKILQDASASAKVEFKIGEIKTSFLVDNEGLIFNDKEPQNESLPKIFIAEEFLLGEKMDPNIIKGTLWILNKVKELGVFAKEARIYPSQDLIINTDPKLIFSLNEDINKQLASLQLILQKAKIDEEVMEFIDLRFSKPVVKYLPKKGVK
jgi:hypothetical protein